MRLPFCLILLALASPAAARDDDPVRTLTVVNDTSAAVNQLFVDGGKRGLKARVGGVFGTPDSGRDRLDAKTLPRGGSIQVALKGERCRYDLRAVLEDGRTYRADDFDICEHSRWSIASGARQ